MGSSFLSEMWYRVAELRPQLHAHVHIVRQRYRGQAWYVLLDRSSGRSNRFTPATYALIDGMDGRQTVNDIWTQLAQSLGDHAPSQDEVIELLYRLHAADVLLVEGLPDLSEAVERQRKQSRSVWLRNLMNPMSVRIALWDPNRFLEASWPWVAWLFSPLAAVIWPVVVVAAGLQAAQHWTALTENLSDRVLGLENLLWLWLTYPFVKLCHELAHAYAVKRGGGEVHEMGVMFLVLAPVPYVDASASAAFRSKWARIGVAAAGILAEVFLAALAMFVWQSSTPGAIRAMAFNVMLIGGVSTVMFNANPLLRFDGYYMLSDWIEIPNLAQRANQYWGFLMKRYVFGREDEISPALGRAEAIWMGLYAPTAWVYRLFVMVAISLFIAAKYFFVGVVLALWSAFSMLVLPLLKSMFFVLTNAQLDRHRQRAIGATFGGLALVLALLILVPVPNWTNAQGVVWVPRNAEVRAGTNGFVQHQLVKSGLAVDASQALVQLNDPALRADLISRQAKVEQLETQLASEMFEDRLQAELTRQTLEAERAVLERLERRNQDLVAVAGREGTWMVPNADDLSGRYYAQGSLIGYVLSGTLRTVRVVVPQEEAELVRDHTMAIQVKLVDRPWETFDARMDRDVPAGSDQLPSKALTIDGGGLFASDPRDKNGLKTLSRTFQFDLDLDSRAHDLAFGTRAYVRFEHAPQPLAVQGYRHLRQTLMAHLKV
jgi:putative peptide zinc metalloprotease protein